MQKPLAIFLMGPTASGKTDLAIQLRKTLPVEVISVDSALIYKGMDIGTAKPSKEELEQAPHRLIDIIDPVESYSVANFREDALREMAEITNAGRIPLLVGGTMLYYKGLIEGLSPLPSSQVEIREQIQQKAQQRGWGYLHKELLKIDPISGNRINENDSQRIGRALEVFYISGKTMTELTEQKGESLPYDFLQFAIAPKERSILHNRIEQRFHKMIELGFKQEVEKLFARDDLHIDLPSIRCVGYRQMWEHLQGDISLDEAIFKGICATRQLAKRQITWLRGWKNEIEWLDSLEMQDSYDKMKKIIELKL